MSLRILIADDHGVLRAGLRALLNEETDYEVVGEAADSDEVVHAALELKPDIVLMDLSMPGAGGLEVTRQLREELPRTRIVILTVHEDATLLKEAVKAGAAGYVIKRAVESELFAALAAARRGEFYVHPSMTRALLENGTGTNSHRRGDPDSLTPREKEIATLVARGYTNRQVADGLGLSIRTVETHRANVLAKLGISTRAELLRWAVANKLTG